VQKVNEKCDVRRRYFEKTGSLLSLNGTHDDKVKPQAAGQFDLSSALSAVDNGDGKEAKSESKDSDLDKDKDKAEDDGQDSEDDDDDKDDEFEEREGDVEDDGEKEDSDKEEEKEAALDADIHTQTFAEAVPVGTKVVASVPKLDKALVSRRIAFNFDVGWFVGRVKKFYNKPRQGLYNFEVRYQHGLRDQQLLAERYGNGDAAAISSWVLLN
jgi:hypothetical protein